MIFASPLFLFVFLPVVLVVYLLLPGLAARNFWLLLASLVFYSWGEPGFVAVLLLSVVANYSLAISLERQTGPGDRKRLLALGVAGNLALLGLFKYFDPLGNWMVQVFWGHPTVFFNRFALPLGISFFTFHALSYLIDVYRQKQRAAADPGILALYILFFPQLIAGPILRWQAIAPQLRHREHSFEKFTAGIRRLIIGLAKKVLLANVLALPADRIFALPARQLSAATAWLGVACYTLQIYYDFSGYSDMAVGMGKMFGFEFLENFRYPYTAQSLRDFWRRWHISLSTWFRDYLYYPLGGNRGSAVRTGLNLGLVFFLCGLWHGAAWTFVIWGLYHGLFLVLERTRLGSFLERLPRLFRHGYALLVVGIGWVFFRAENVSAAGHYLYALAGLGRVSEPQAGACLATRLVW
jgi:alginate O-acetyltransferase complex protein AlgI